MSERNPYIDAQRGRAAEDLLENPLLVEAFDNLEAAYLAEWRASKPLELEERERLWLAVQVLGEVRQHLRVIVENGVIAKRDLERLAGRR